MSSSESGASSKSTLGKLALLARCRGVPIRDANRRWRIVVVHDDSLIARNRVERVISITIAVIASMDMPGLVAGTSPRQHNRQRVFYNALAAIVGLILGFLIRQIMSSTGLGPGIFLFALLLFSIAFAYAYAARFANPMVFATSLSLPSVITAVGWTISGSFTQALVLLLLGVGAGAAAFVAGRYAERQRPRDVVQGRGRECARCGYDLRAIADGKPCPECGSLERVR